MNHKSTLLAVGLSLTALPGLCHAFVSSERFSNNPMNAAGVTHNDYVGCMASQYADGEKGIPLEVLVYQCGFPTQGVDKGEFVEKYSGIVKEANGDPGLSLVENLGWQRELYNEEQFSYFEDIDKILQTSTTAEEADKLLQILEENAVKNLGREDADLTVLGALSTARYSLELWVKGPGIEASTTSRGIPWGWILTVVTADVSGYATGNGHCGKICGFIVGGIKSLQAALGNKE